MSDLGTLDSGVDVGQGKFGKNLRSFVMKKPEKIIFPLFNTKFNERRAF